MALTADYQRIEGYDSLTEDEAVTRDSLVWASMAVGINRLTAENAGEFYARVNFWERVHGAYRHNENGPLFLTRPDVDRFIGLSTNASPMTEAAFYKHVYKAYRRFVQ